MVVGVHRTDHLDSIAHSFIVSCDFVIIEFVIADLNTMDILAADIRSAYPNSPCHEKFYFTARDKFVNRKYSNIIVVCDLYGINSSGSAWRSHCVETMRYMNLVPLEGDNDV